MTLAPKNGERRDFTPMEVIKIHISHPIYGVFTTSHPIYGVFTTTITYSAPHVMLDSLEMKKEYVLSPFAPEFIPRAKRHNETFLKIFNDSLKQFTGLDLFTNFKFNYKFQMLQN